MAKLLFTHSYYLQLDPKQLKQQQPYPPLGTLYAAAVAREAGHEVFLHDTMFADSAFEIIPSITKNKPEYLVIYDDGFNYLTKMCLTNMREAAFKMIQFAKEAGCKVIVSSSDATDHIESYLDTGADYIIIGEGEITLKELIDYLDCGNFSARVPNGVAFRNNGKMEKTPPREVIHNLDDLPMPAWDLLHIVPYQNAWIKNWGHFSLNIATTRGCPYKCNWCAKPIYGNRYNSRSPQHVINELIYLKEIFQFDHIWFCDDIFGLKPGWISEFADLIEKEHLELRFKIQCRVDLIVNEKTVEALKRAGCDTVWMGAESGSQKILDAMDKGTKVEQIHEASHLLKKHGIKPAFFLQFGYPGETKKDIGQTLEMLFELMPDDIGVSVSYPLPGTKFYDAVKQDLKLKSNWTDSDDLSLMFHNTYPAGFYKRLHRFVHKKYRLKQSLQIINNIIHHHVPLQARQLKKIVSLLYYLPASIIDSIRLRFLYTS